MIVVSSTKNKITLVKNFVMTVFVIVSSFITDVLKDKTYCL